MVEHSFNTLMQRLARAGFRRQFVNTALLPDWWDEAYADDPNILPDIEVRIARFFDTSIEDIRNVEIPLAPPSYNGVQLRQVRRNMRQSRLRPAIHTALRVSQAVVRNLRCTGTATAPIPPSDALEWRRILLSGNDGRPVRLENALSDLWARGIPVIPLQELPSPSFQALACFVDNHPAIVLGHKYDEPGRVAFLVAHEAGHLATGDCSSESPVVLDAEDAEPDDSDIERAVDRYAVNLLLGEETVAIPECEDLDAKVLAQKAFELEGETNADASSIIYAWAAKKLQYKTARAAVEALYRAVGARHQARTLFDKYVDLESAGESDRSLLRCVYGETHTTAAAS